MSKNMQLAKPTDDELARLRKVEEALTNLLPEPLPWREEGEGMFAITVHKKDLRAARAALTSGKSNA